MANDAAAGAVSLKHVAIRQNSVRQSNAKNFLSVEGEAKKIAQCVIDVLS